MSRIWIAVIAVTIGAAALIAAPDTGSAADKGDSYGLVDPATGIWHLYVGGTEVGSFYFGNPGDYPFMGDWNCDDIDTPGLYRQSDGYVYLRNSNSQGNANISFFFGNPGDVPIAGDFNADGCDTVSIYRPSNQTFYIINKLGTSDGGLGAADYSYVFGNPGDKPFIGDFNGNGQDTPGLHRESTGLVYYRNTNTQGNADNTFIYGDPGDRFVAGDWTANGIDSPGVFRPSNTTMYLRFENSQGNADRSWNVGSSAWLPVAGEFGISLPPPPTTTTTKPPTPPLTWSSKVLDSNGAVGEHVDMVLINDRPFAAYYDTSNGDLKTAYCDDPECLSVTYNWPDFSGSQAGRNASVAIMPSGNPVIAYLHDSSNEVRIAFCDNVVCSTSSLVTLIADHEENFDLDVAPDGTPALAYQDNYVGVSTQRHELHYLKCDDSACNTFTDTLVDGGIAPAYVGEYPSLDFGVDNLPIISYYDRRNEDLKVAHCEDSRCTSATVTAVDTAASAGTFTSIKVLPDGTAGIAYNRSATTYFAKCLNVACTASSLHFIDSSWGYYTDIAVRNGFPVISFRWPLFDEVNVAVCESLDCTSKVVYNVGTADTGYCCLGTTAIDVDSKRRIWVAYFDGLYYEVELVRSN